MQALFFGLFSLATKEFPTGLSIDKCCRYAVGLSDSQRDCGAGEAGRRRRRYGSSQGVACEAVNPRTQLRGLVKS